MFWIALVFEEENPQSNRSGLRRDQLGFVR